MLSPDGEWLWNGSQWIPAPPINKPKNTPPLPNLGTAYVLNFFFPGIGILYLGKPGIGLFIYFSFVALAALAISASSPDTIVWFIFAFCLQIAVVIDTKAEFQKLLAND